jgi:AcrR family transcriptional regulator
VAGDRGLLAHDGAELRVDALRNQRKILRAAARLLAEDPAVSVQRIADEAAVARPTVYRRYPTREALVDAILQEAAAEMVAAIRAAVEAGEDPVTTLRHLIVGLAEIGAGYPILLGTSGLEVHHRRGQRPAGSRRAEAFAALDGVIEAAQADGQIGSGLDPAVLRQAILGGLALSIRSGAGPARVVGEQVAGLLLDGARPRA